MRAFILARVSSVKLQSNISEARGLVVDMLANRDLPPAVVSCLRVVAALLNPQPLQSNISEARGLVVDMLANRDLPPAVVSCLRVVAALLNPQPPTVNLHADFGLPMVVENPLSGEQLVVSAVSLFT
uniref:Adaptin_N domain-containing protein n=1 Tax=Ascaris lumbricoides TaxID=6252 RepID=A0A0M3I687_ASCLU